MQDAVQLQLPYPPSVNRYWRIYRGQARLSSAGRAYKESAFYRTERRFTSAVALAIGVWFPDRLRRDMDNLLKAPLDALVHAGILVDDSLVKRIVIEQSGFLPGGRLDITITLWEPPLHFGD